MRQILPMLAAALVGVAGIAFRSYALRAYSTLPSDFDGPVFYRVRYLLRYHRFLLQYIEPYSFWSSGVNTQLGFYLMEFLNALLLQVSQWAAISPRTLHQIVLTPALIAAALCLLRQGRTGNRTVGGAAIVSSLATLGTPVVITYLTGWNAAYGWVVLLALTLVATSALSSPAKVVLTFALALAGPPLYHTFGFVLTWYVVLLYVAARLLNLQRLTISPLPVIVSYLTYQIYVSRQFFGELMQGIVDLARLDFLRRDAAMRVAVESAGSLRYLHLVLWILLCMPIGLVTLRYLRYLRARRHSAGTPGDDEDVIYAAATVSMSAAVVILAIAFGVKFSLEFLVNRGAEYLALPAIIAAITELRYHVRRKPGRACYIYPLAGAVLAMSLYSFSAQATTVRASNYITGVEAEGYAWLKARLQETDVVWTDFRLSGPFIAGGHFRVLGIVGSADKLEASEALLREIYYAATPGSITSGIERVRTWGEGRPARYLFLSTEMMKPYPGLNGFGTHFEPAPARFFQLLNQSPDWTLIYYNEQVRIYERQRATP